MEYSEGHGECREKNESIFNAKIPTLFPRWGFDWEEIV